MESIEARREIESLPGDAYTSGLVAGRLDFGLHTISRYSWYSIGDANPYACAYGRGYRTGWLEAERGRREGRTSG